MSVSIRNIKKNSVCPDVAYPTLGLFGFCSVSYIIILLLNSSYLFPEFQSFSFPEDATWIYWTGSLLFGIVSFIVEVVICYSSFTVTHDAIHRSVIKKYPYLNDTIGFISQLFLGPTSNWWILRWAHLIHHFKTNDEIHDPDHWASVKGPGGKLLTPLRWLTIDLNYFLLYFRLGFFRKRLKHQVLTILYQCVMITALYWCYNANMFGFLLQHWIIPSRIALFILSIFFDFIPHYPHDVKRDDNKFKTTSYLYVPYILRPFASFVMFEQIYHSAHHINQSTPFYKYKEIWALAKKELIREGIPIKNILPQTIAEKMAQIIYDEDYELIYDVKYE